MGDLKELNEQLSEQARKLAEERGWTWREPVEITSGLHQGEAVWVVRSNVVMRSPSVRVEIRKSDLLIVESGYLPR
jgi:hypothetical protein